ncbi:hypothetical protein F0562_013777 [Nyssa sinensis]|uniref:MCM3-like winged helix domain-containing protein n=1 Tax=Nyssa sinensis TaxID=561372 RepID=A0A5J4ZR12_9ASTE|nr:hypothetical protein F0562_013777 [Nyssa sinensis]
MEVDDPPAAQPNISVSPERIEAFNSLLGQHVGVHHLDRISIADIETVVNAGAAVPYSREEVIFLLEKLGDNKVMIHEDTVHIL